MNKHSDIMQPALCYRAKSQDAPNAPAKSRLCHVYVMIVLMLGAIFFSGLALSAVVIGHEGGMVLVSLNGLRMLGYKQKSLLKKANFHRRERLIAGRERIFLW